MIKAALTILNIFLEDAVSASSSQKFCCQVSKRCQSSHALQFSYVDMSLTQLNEIYQRCCLDDGLYIQQ
jgi:hypothetical protein